MLTKHFNYLIYIFRVFWAFVFLCSIIGCITVIQNVYIKWQLSPDIGFTEKITSVWEIPFPAVTICPQTKAQSYYVNFTETYYKFYNNSQSATTSDRELYHFGALTQVCDSLFVHDPAFIFAFNKSYDVMRMLKEMAVKQDDAMNDCKWANRKIKCEKFFTETLTEEGICFTFNMIDYQELFKDNM